MKTLETIQVVLASPSDLTEEREMIRKLVDNANIVNTRHGIFIDLRMWEKSAPGMNENGPQGVIDLDLEIPKADIFICLYWKRVGTEVQGEGIAGTEHELNLALKYYQKNGTPDVKAFFKKIEEELDTADTTHIKEIAKRLQPLGLYSPFDSIESLQSKVNQIFQEAIMNKLRGQRPVEPLISHHVEVSSTKDLVKNMSPGNRIILEKGYYDILDFPERTDYLYKNNVFDGEEVTLFNVSNLTIIGDSASILVRPRYANVLTFGCCENIKISGLSFGHVPDEGYCSGAVIKLINCKNIQFDNCAFFGCGTYGLQITDSSNIIVNGSHIFKCTYGAINVVNSTLMFKNSKITDCVCQCDSLISIYGGTVSLDNVSIHENKTNKELFFLQSVKVHDRANPDKPDEQVAAWLFPRGVCAYNNTYTELCNEDLDRRFLWEKTSMS